MAASRSSPPLRDFPCPKCSVACSAADLSDDEMEEVHIDPPPDPGSGIGEDGDAEPAGYNHEEVEEEHVDDEEETDVGGEETVDPMQHWTDAEAKAALTYVRKWITWQGYAPL